MRTTESVAALFSDGAIVECVENTYRPELNGTRRRVDRAGATVLDCTPLDGPGAGERGFRMALPSRAGDVVALSENTVTYRLGPPASAKGDHTVTLRVVGGE